MKKNITIINGTGGSGKDTFVDFCSKHCKVFNFSSIDKIKEIASLMGWDGGKTEKDRKFLSDLKTLSTDYNDMPFCSIKEAVDEFKNSDKEVMFIHIREPIEIKRAALEFGAKTLLIKRVGLDIIKSNISDANVENYDYDFVIENDTLEDFEEKAKDFIDSI